MVVDPDVDRRLHDEFVAANLQHVMENLVDGAWGTVVRYQRPPLPCAISWGRQVQGMAA